jgi:uncharacterized damage-inducible protein DinB
MTQAAAPTTPRSIPHDAPEPWLRGTLTDIDPIRRAVLHALELAAEDATRWTANLTSTQLFARPAGLAPIAFHLRHIARSLDRLLTYAEGNQLDATQQAALKTELAPEQHDDPRIEFHQALQRSTERIRAISPNDFATPRGVGRKQLPTTVGGLLVHCADHTQRHTGQLVTTAKLALNV